MAGLQPTAAGAWHIAGRACLVGSDFVLALGAAGGFPHLDRSLNPNAFVERIAIALGARMGNAVVLTLLGFVLLSDSGAAEAERAVFVLVVAGMFWFAFAYLTLRPREALAAYRG